MHDVIKHFLVRNGKWIDPVRRAKRAGERKVPEPAWDREGTLPWTHLHGQAGSLSPFAPARRRARGQPSISRKKFEKAGTSGQAGSLSWRLVIAMPLKLPQTFESHRLRMAIVKREVDRPWQN